MVLSRRADNELRLLQRALSSTQDGAMITDASGPDDPIVWVNAAFERITGYAAEEALGRNPRFLQAGDGDQPALDSLRSSRERNNDGIEWTGVVRNYRKDGTPFWNELSAAAVRDERGYATHHIGLISDVSERREAEEKLRFQAQLLEAVGQATVAIDLDRRIVYWNRAAEELYGWSSEEVVGRLADEVLVVEDQKERAEEIWAELKAGRDWSGEFVVRRRDGTSLPVAVTDTPVFDERGSPVGMIGVSADITERKLAEEVLRGSERRFRSLVQNASDVITLLDPDGAVRYMSPAIERWTGRPPEELVGENALDYVHPDDLERVASKLAGCAADPASRPTVEYRFRHKGGYWRHLESVATNLLDDAAVGAIVVNTRDVTERKEAEERRREAETRYRALVERLPAIVYVQEPSAPSATTYISPHAEEILGYPQERFTADPEWWVKIIHPDDRERVLAEDERTNRTGEPFVSEYRMCTADGRVLWFSDEAVLVRDEEGRPLYWLGVQTDVTERKRFEGELRLRNRAIEASNNGIVITDPNLPDSPMVYVNPAFERMTGYGSGDLVGQNCRMLQGSDRDQPDLDALRDSISGGREFRGVLRNYRKDGSLFYNELHIAPVFDAEGHLSNFVGAMCDVTERERSGEEMRETNRRLEELATLKADFTAMVAHELGSPLAAVRAYVDMLATGEPGPEERARALERILAETEILGGLIADVRFAASVERDDFSLRVRPVPAGGLLDDAATFAQTLAPNHPLRIETECPDLEVAADPYRIGQVLRNLIQNAAKYSPEETPVTLRAIPVGARGGGPEHVRIEVADRGQGIHPDDRRRIFEKFGRGRTPSGEKVPGTGLGLYLSRRIVRAHGGDLNVNSKPGEGSVFSFDLKVARKPVP